jgi:hypothetical protein
MLEYRPHIFAAFGALLLIELLWNWKRKRGNYNAREAA